jgi:hypothetical protein
VARKSTSIKNTEGNKKRTQGGISNSPVHETEQFANKREVKDLWTRVRDCFSTLLTSALVPRVLGIGALGSDMAPVMALETAFRVIVDEGGFTLQLVEMGRRAAKGSMFAFMEPEMVVVLYEVCFILKGVFAFFRGNGVDPTRLELGIEGST